jgi:hypothetical protein
MLPKSRQRSGRWFRVGIKGANHSADGFDVAKESTTIGSDGFGLDSIKGGKTLGADGFDVAKEFHERSVTHGFWLFNQRKHSSRWLDGFEFDVDSFGRIHGDQF